MIPQNKFIYFLILMYLFDVCLALDGITNGGNKPLSEIGLEINTDKNDYLTKQPISIYFNFSNLKNNSDAKNIKLQVELTKIIASPNINLKIGNKGLGEPINNREIGNFSLESSFDGNKEHNDEVTAYKTGEVEIEIGTLKKSGNISIKYTSFINKSILDCASIDICNISMLSWDFPAKSNPPEIGKIRICPNEPNRFSIKIKPEYNVILWEGLNCSAFNNSEIYFYPEKSLDNEVNMVFLIILLRNK